MLVQTGLVRNILKNQIENTTLKITFYENEKY